MKVPVVTKEAFTIIGIEYFGKNQKGEIPALWQVFNERDEEIKNRMRTACYGVCGTMDQEGNFSYVAGVEVPEVEELPDGMTVKNVATGKYAQFTYKDDLSKLQDFYGNIHSKWLKENGLEYDLRPDFEYYDERFMKNGEFEIYIPVK